MTTTLKYFSISYGDYAPNTLALSTMRGPVECYAKIPCSIRGRAALIRRLRMNVLKRKTSKRKMLGHGISRLDRSNYILGCEWKEGSIVCDMEMIVSRCVIQEIKSVSDKRNKGNAHLRTRTRSSHTLQLRFYFFSVSILFSASTDASLAGGPLFLILRHSCDNAPKIIQALSAAARMNTRVSE
jgi:hypothetical protein